MKQTLLIIGALVLIGLIGLAAYFIFHKTPPVAQNPGTTTLPTTGGTQPGVNGSAGDLGISLATADGTTVTAKNFKTDSATAQDPINKGYYYLGYHTPEGVPDASATTNPPYVIEYIEATQYFNIALLKEPLGATRSEAEQFLRTKLGIPQDQLCKIKYMVSVPFWINPVYGGASLGFSFCPGAVQLPQ